MGKTNEDRKEEKKKKGKLSCCEREGLRRGAWTAEEDKILVNYITENGHGTWTDLPKLAGLFRCGKSCRLRWTNYLRPDIKRGPFSPDEENTIIQLHESLGNKWAAIASHLSGRTDNDVKNFWNSHLRKRFSNKTLDRPSSSDRVAKPKPNSRLDRHMAQRESVRLSVNPPYPLNFTQGDYYLNLWNSEIGTSFRKVNEVNLTSQTSSVTKVEPSGKSGSHREVCGKETDNVAAARSDTSSKWCEDQTMMEDDSLEAMMSLLLDFPVGDDDYMAFF